MTESTRLFESGPNTITRSLLKDQVLDYLRDHLVNGYIEQGAKLVERDLAEQIGISRIPVRDALLQLEAEGLVVSKSNGRYVIEISERDISELYQVRLSLETLAVELATQNTSPQNRAALSRMLQNMKQAIADGDEKGYPRSDVEIHRLIWTQANNRHLIKTLNSMIGPISMFIATHGKYYSTEWDVTLALHEDLIACINAGDVQGAKESIKRHMENALQRSHKVFVKK